MYRTKELINALEKTVPGFKGPVLFNGLPLEDEIEDICFWIEELLGEQFCCYIEWKDFEGWGLDAVQDLLPIHQLNIELTLAEQPEEAYLADPMGFLEGGEGEFYLPQLNHQLAPHKLQLVELGGMFENARLLCITTHQASVNELVQALENIGVDLLDHQRQPS